MSLIQGMAMLFWMEGQDSILSECLSYLDLYQIPTLRNEQNNNKNKPKNTKAYHN